jgi:hypothetical protein
LDPIHEPRDEDRIVYDKKILIWSGILLFLLKLSSRRQFNQEGRSLNFLDNLNKLADTEAETIPYDGTIAYFLEKLPVCELEPLSSKMVTRLIRMKALDKDRLIGHFLIAIDGSGILKSTQRHCEHCLTQTKNGKTLYFHRVLEAKLVTEGGLALSVATEFIENTDLNASKQDCELKAFRRIETKIKNIFPQLRICLLLDGLYACAPVFDICRKNRWRFIITFKKGSMPEVYQEFSTLRRLLKDQREVDTKRNLQRTYAWVNDLPYKGHALNVFQEMESSKKERTNFVWLTNFNVTSQRVKKLAQKGGRLRWKIENEGFNIQKNGGYNLEHAYSKDNNAAKHFYFLLQIAHILNQLMVHGSLLQGFQDMLGSLKNFSRRMAEHLRYLEIPDEMADLKYHQSFQIRLDSS